MYKVCYGNYALGRASQRPDSPWILYEREEKGYEAIHVPRIGIYLSNRDVSRGPQTSRATCREHLPLGLVFQSWSITNQSSIQLLVRAYSLQHTRSISRHSVESMLVAPSHSEVTPGYPERDQN